MEGDFGAEGEPARNVTYRAKVTAQAGAAEIQELMRQTDRVAEIQNTLRAGTPVTLSGMEAVTLRAVHFGFKVIGFRYLMTITIRPLADADLAAVDEILMLAFQSAASRLPDLQLYRRMQPDGWFVAARGETPVGMVGAVNYGAVAHVGFMAVHPHAQRQGIGLALMQFLLADLELKGAPLVTLDASAAGRHLYESLGFVPYDETVLLQRQDHSPVPPRSAPLHNLTVQDLDELVQADTHIFGADRRKVFQVLLEAFPGCAHSAKG